ncbi:hypothetical protein M2G37_19850, partial [Vibrio vulnificus]|nr:hypothetical protein [Vibrio vulnificus]
SASVCGMGFITKAVIMGKRYGNKESDRSDTIKDHHCWCFDLLISYPQNRALSKVKSKIMDQ